MNRAIFVPILLNMQIPDNTDSHSLEIQEAPLKKEFFLKQLITNSKTQSIIGALFILIIGLLGIALYLGASGRVPLFSFSKESNYQRPTEIMQSTKESALQRFLSARNNAASTKISATPSPTINPTKTPTLTPSIKSKTLTPTKKVASTPTKIPQSTPTHTLTPSPTQIPTSTPIPYPPTFEISYPNEGQYIELTSSQTLCIVDYPTGNYTAGSLKRRNINNNGWTEYATPDGTCFDPLEGQNTFSFQYKNSQGIESVVYTRSFSFHRL